MSESVLNFKNSTFGKMHFNNIFTMKMNLNTYLYYLFVLTICIKNMPGGRSIAMKSIRTTILTL